MAPDTARAVAVVITGTVGSGKTSVADAMGDIVSEAGVPNAVIDLDWLRRSWPVPAGDRFNLAMELRNLRDVARNYLTAGVRRLILAGVVESMEDRDRYRDAVGVPLLVARLAVDLSVVRDRLGRRHAHDPDGLQWHLARSGELHAILEAAGIEDVLIDATGSCPAETAHAVISALGWDRVRAEDRAPGLTVRD